MMRRTAGLMVSLTACGAVASAQSLFQQSSPEAAAAAEQDPAAPLYGVSLYVIEPPKPREFQENDLITILVREESLLEREQTVESEKDYTLQTPRVQLPETVKFLLLNGDPADVANLPELGVESNNEFEGEGEYEREDRIEARITARVMEAKPNGTLLLEARSVIQTDEETSTYLLSGICRTEDVTEQNTVLSSQIFDLQLNVQHEGELRKATKKGLFPRVLETLFNF